MLENRLRYKDHLRILIFIDAVYRNLPFFAKFFYGVQTDRTNWCKSISNEFWCLGYWRMAMGWCR